MKSAVAENLSLLKRLAAINRTMTASLDFEESLNLIAGSGAELVGASSCLVLLREPDERLRIRAAQGVDRSVAAGFIGPMQESVLDDLRKTLGLGDSGSLAAAPIMSERTVQGIMVVVRDTPLDSEETWLLSALADQAAITLGNARLHEKLQEEMEGSQKLVRDLEAFLHAVAHDLRSPLRIMTSCGDLLLHDYGGQFLSGNGRDYLTRIAFGARKMDTLIQDLLTYSNLARGKRSLEPVDLEDAVSDVLGEISDRVLVRVRSPLGKVLANRAVVVQILRSLLSNALKFVRPGDVPSVELKAEPLGEFVRVSVSDTGIGISEKHLDRIFGVFERLNRAEEFPGTGIGLAIVRRGVEGLGGRCGVESEPGKGSRFWVDLRGA
jgi:signal transduction histidine kinase